MVDHPLKDIDVFNTVESKLPQIIEYFVSYYGEKYREVITRRLNKAIYVYVDKKDTNTYDLLKEYFDNLHLSYAKYVLQTLKVQNIDENAKILANNFHLMKNLRKWASDLTLVNSADALTILNCFEVFGPDKLSSINISKLSETSYKDLETIIEGISQIWEENLSNYEYIEKEYRKALPADLEKEIDLLPENERSSYFNEKRLFNTIQYLHQEDLKFEKSLLQLVKIYAYVPDEIAALTYNTVKHYNPKENVSICLLRNGLWMCTFFIVHELNHVIEAEVLSSGSKKIVFKTGFFVEETSLETEKNIKTTPHNLFNEAINDYLSYQIYTKMREDDFKIALPEFLTSSYMVAFPLIKPFIEENFEDLVECRITKTYKDFAKIIGKTNYENFAKLTHDLISVNNIDCFFDDAIKEIKDNAGEDVDFYSFLSHPQKENLSPKAQNFLTYFDLGKRVLNNIKKHKSQSSKNKQTTHSVTDKEQENEEE